MRRLSMLVMAILAILAILVIGCSGPAPRASTGLTVGPSTAATAAAPSGDGGTPSTEPSTDGASAPSATTAGAGDLPADCAEGFGAYLTAIEPVVADFDPATATLADLGELDQAVGSKSIELLDANDSSATYDCSAIGLSWAYFDASSPWDAVLGFAATAAPGTVPYLTAVRDVASIDLATVSDYGVDGCEAAVTSLKEQIAAKSAGGKGARDLGLADALPILGLYKAYMADVRNEVCPRDQLGNDEYDFFLGV